MPFQSLLFHIQIATFSPPLSRFFRRQTKKKGSLPIIGRLPENSFCKG